MHRAPFVAAALLALGAPAVARDRMAPAEPAMRACPEYGSGFVRLPGSSTCVRVSGRVTARVDAGGGVRATDPVAGRFNIDTRSETDYGTARTFTRIGSDRPMPR